MKTRILLGPMSSAAGRTGVARLLANAPGGRRSAIAVEQCDVWEDVSVRLAAEPFDVLIAEFGAGSPTIDRLLQLQPGLAVIEVDLAGGTVNLHAVASGNGTVVRLAEWLSREAGLVGAADPVARVAHGRPELPKA